MPSLSRLLLAEPDRQDAIDGEDVFHMSLQPYYAWVTFM
jgi:hypothetical protein